MKASGVTGRHTGKRHGVTRSRYVQGQVGWQRLPRGRINKDQPGQPRERRARDPGDGACAVSNAWPSLTAAWLPGSGHRILNREEREACVSEGVSIIGEKSISQRPFSRLGVMCLWPEQVPQATLSCGEGQEKPSRAELHRESRAGPGPIAIRTKVNCVSKGGTRNGP